MSQINYKGKLKIFALRHTYQYSTDHQSAYSLHCPPFPLQKGFLVGGFFKTFCKEWLQAKEESGQTSLQRGVQCIISSFLSLDLIFTILLFQPAVYQYNTSNKTINIINYQIQSAHQIQQTLQPMLSSPQTNVNHLNKTAIYFLSSSSFILRFLIPSLHFCTYFAAISSRQLHTRQLPSRHTLSNCLTVSFSFLSKAWVFSSSFSAFFVFTSIDKIDMLLFNSFRSLIRGSIFQHKSLLISSLQSSYSVRGGFAKNLLTIF